MRIWAILVVAAALAACGRAQDAGYPPAVEANFMNACEAQRPAVAGLCACTWDEIEANVAPGELVALEILPAAERASHPLQQQINGYALACAQRLATEPAAGP